MLIKNAPALLVEMPVSQSPVPAFRSRVLAIASGKGGVGKTNVAVNLGLALARRGVRVGLLDADLGTANVDVVLGLKPRYHLQHVVTGHCSLQEILIEGPHGLLVVPGASGLPDLADLPEAQRNALLRALVVLDGVVDVLLIDLGAGVGRDVLQFILAAGEALLVTTPEPTALIDAYALIKVLSSYESPVNLSLVVNNEQRSGEGDLTGEKMQSLVAQFLGRRVEVLGALPHDRHVSYAVREQTPLLLRYPQAPASLAIDRLASRLWHGERGAVEEVESGGGIRRFFRKLLSVPARVNA